MPMVIGINKLFCFNSIITSSIASVEFLDSITVEFVGSATVEFVGSATVEFVRFSDGLGFTGTSLGSIKADVFLLVSEFDIWSSTESPEGRPESLVIDSEGTTTGSTIVDPESVLSVVLPGSLVGVTGSLIGVTVSPVGVTVSVSFVLGPLK